MTLPRTASLDNIVALASDILLEERGRISLLYSPFRTISLFLCYTSKWLWRNICRLVRNPVVYGIVFPFLVSAVFISLFVIPSFSSHIFAVLDVNGDGLVGETELENYYKYKLNRTPGTGRSAAATFPHALGSLTRQQFAQWWSNEKDMYRHSAYFSHHWWREAEFYMLDALFWFVLGVLSSIGLGTGMHSGLLFLFPHIYLICTAVSKCGSANFWTYPINPFYGPRERVFVCISPAAARHALPSLWICVIKVLPACVLWGAGTALGEVPPYLLSYAAALQGKRQSELEASSTHDMLNRMKQWMLNKIQKFGFWAVLMLAAWPNMAFDLCGMACGQFRMPFWTFFSATLIGKALIKVVLQAIFFVALFSGNNIENMVRWLGNSVAACVPFRFDGVVDKVVQSILKARESIANRATDYAGLNEGVEGADGGDSVFIAVLNGLLIVVMAWFAKSIIEFFAVSEQEERDQKRTTALEMFVRKELLSSEWAHVGYSETKELLYSLAKSGSHPVSLKINDHSLKCSCIAGRSCFLKSWGGNLALRLQVYVPLAMFAYGYVTAKWDMTVLGSSLLLHTWMWHNLRSNDSVNAILLYASRFLVTLISLYMWIYSDFTIQSESLHD